jgi:hypothetical protein
VGAFLCPGGHGAAIESTSAPNVTPLNKLTRKLQRQGLGVRESHGLGHEYQKRRWRLGAAVVVPSIKIPHCIIHLLSVWQRAQD